MTALRNRVTIYSFALTVFVIWLHAGESLVSSIPGQIAVPGFFLLSGFLFFGGIGSDGAPWDRIGDKLKRRARTLLIPYLLWNTIYFAACLITGRAEPGEFIMSVLMYHCNPVFWYLFQLILITAAAPVLYIFMRRRHAAVVWLIVIFVLAVFYLRLPWHYCNEDALFYYSLGVFAALHCPDIASAGFPKKSPAGPAAEREEGSSSDTAAGPAAEQETGAFAKKPEPEPGRFSPVPLIGALLLFALFYIAEPALPGYLINISLVGWRAAGAVAFWFMTGLLEHLFAKLCKKRSGRAHFSAAGPGQGDAGFFAEDPGRPPCRMHPPAWMRINFFVYATHYMVIRIVWAGETAAGLNGSAAANMLTYILMPAVCISAAYGLYRILKRHAKAALYLLTGGRGE